MSEEQTNAEPDIKTFQQLLEERGYTEKNLNNGEPPGRLASTLREGFEACVALMKKEDNGGVIIQAHAKAPYDNEIIALEFHFNYSGATGKFEYDHMEADKGRLHMHVTSILDSAMPELKELCQHFSRAELEQIRRPAPNKKNNNGFRLN